MLIKELEKLGLNQKEAQMYLALLELGEANLVRLCQKSAIKRTTAYDIIESLKEKGLISTVIKRKRTYYFAENPKKIAKNLDEKKERLEAILPDLLAITNLIDRKPKIRYFEGNEGLKEVYKDTLNYPGQELLAWVSEEAVEVFDEKFLNEYYLPKRVKNKIWVRAIAPDKSYFQQKYATLDEKSLRKTKLAPVNDLCLAIEINLYGKNKIGMMSFQEKIGLIIESEKIYKTLKSIFEMNWRSIH